MVVMEWKIGRMELPNLVFLKKKIHSIYFYFFSFLLFQDPHVSIVTRDDRRGSSYFDI